MIANHTKQADLNLLTALQALMEERSISKAARRMFLTQPAMSRVLDRLQATFEDELLVRTRSGYEPTNRALSIYTELLELLPRLESLFRKSEFNPARAAGVFRIEATDWGATIIISRLLKILAKRAPGIRLEVLPRVNGLWQLEDNSVDLVLSNHAGLTERQKALRTEPLFQEQIVCVVRSGHPLAVHRRLTLRTYLKAQHVVLVPMQDTRSLPMSWGGYIGAFARSSVQLVHKRDVRVETPYFGPLASIVENTDLVATVPKQMAEKLMKTRKTHIIRAPREFKNFTYTQIWHSRDDSNAVHQWLRELMRTIAQSLPNN